MHYDAYSVDDPYIVYIVCNGQLALLSRCRMYSDVGN